MPPAELIDDRFGLEEEVATGGMGTVYRARDYTTGSMVAVKVLRPLGRADDVERFSRERSLLAKLSSPGVVKYLAHGQTKDGRQFLVMEWVAGGTLASRLQTRGLTLVESVAVARGVATALAEVHRCGVIHRDLTPRNLMFESDQSREVKILDFGVARRQRGIQLTRTGVVVGSPGYMAPEQARGQKDLDVRVDIFALGCILYECLTGRAAFVGDGVSLPIKVLFADPLAVREINANVSPALDFLVRRMLSKNRLHRPTDADEVATELSGLDEVETPPLRRSSQMSEQVETALVDPHRKTIVTEVYSPDAKQRFTFLLLVGPGAENPVDWAQTTTTRRLEMEASLEGVAPINSQIEIVHGGLLALKIAISATAQEAAELSARSALILRARFPGLCMALVAESSPNPDMGALIERASTHLCREDMEIMFQGLVGAKRTEDVILLDELSHRLFQGRYKLIENGSAAYLPAQLLPS